MKRNAVVCLIVCYLSALGWGIVSHTLSIGNVAHPAMYYVVWDMFCGWSGYECRHHLIAQGESGEYYKLTPNPWGDFQPYGPANRIDYDNFGIHSRRIAANVLSKTDHEPMRRVMLVEENWSKRYNIPDYLWTRMYEETKSPHSYFHTRAVYDGNCNPVELRNSWVAAVESHQLTSNPNLVQMRKQAQPIYALTSPSTQDLERTASMPPQSTGEILPASYQHRTP